VILSIGLVTILIILAIAALVVWIVRSL